MYFIFFIHNQLLIIIIGNTSSKEKALIFCFARTGSLKAVRPGDCVVAFSRQKIFKIKDEIERKTKLKCSVIYGGLPPGKFFKHMPLVILL